jgi:hypothetical protein
MDRDRDTFMREVSEQLRVNLWNSVGNGYGMKMKVEGFFQRKWNIYNDDNRLIASFFEYKLASDFLLNCISNTPFKLGDPVEKIGGDYTFQGEVVAVVRKKSGLVRYVVEDDRGILFIFNEKSLRMDSRVKVLP